MLNLRAAREQVEKELGSAPSTRRARDNASSGSRSGPPSVSPPRGRRSPEEESRPQEALVVKPLFAVGEKVEYRSDTHRQWLQGVVQKVREGGTVYDLDVKKGAQAGKLRKAIGAAAKPLDLYDKAEAADSGGGSRTALRAASPVLSRPSLGGGAVLEPVTSAGSTRPSRNRGEAAQRAESTEIQQVRPLELDMARLQRPEEWASQAGQEMASRAGAVTVRRMVETTKLLLQNLESALMLRAGFLATCFHTWRAEVDLTKVEGLHRQELEQHHDAWAAHFQQHQQTFEEELAKHARHEMTAKERRRQQADLIVDQWAEGDRKGLLRQVYKAWSHFALQEKRLKRTSARVHTIIFGWAEGKTRGIAHASLLSWRHQAALEAAERQKQDELARLSGSFAEDQAKKDEAFARKLQEIESKRKDRSSSVEAVLAQWSRGKDKGAQSLSFKHWATYSKDRARRDRRHEAVALQLRKWAEGESKGTVHGVWLRWKAEAQKVRLVKQAEATITSQAQKLQSLLEDEQRKSRELHKSQAQILAERRAAAKRLIQYIAARWAGGERKGTLKGIVRGWSSYMMQAKSAGRKRQAVHAALGKAFAGEAKGAAKVALLNWHLMAKEEKMQKRLEQVHEQVEGKWGQFLQDREADHEAELQKAYNSVEGIKARAHHTTQMILRKWMGGDRTGTLTTVFQDWRDFVAERQQADAQRQSVKDSVLRFIESDQRGSMHSCFNAWLNFVKFEAKHQRLWEQQQQKLEAMESQMSSMQKKREVQMLRCAEAFGSKQGPVLMGLALRAWREESSGAKAKEEAERQRLVHLEEMEREREAAEELRHERIARALDGMGCRRTRVILSEYFCAWSYLWERERLEQSHRLNHNEQMQKYSQFLLGQKLQKDAGALLAATFREWHIHGRIAAHELNQDSLEERLRATASYAQQLEQQRGDLQEQLQLYYQQIDLITETLQKELQTKEELASELRDAYDKLRQQSKAQVPMTTPSTMASLETGLLSRASSIDARRKEKETTATPKGQRTPRPATAASNAKLAAVQQGEPLAVPTLPPARRSRGRNDDSPSNCDWKTVVQRMSEEGMVHLDNK